MTMTEPGGKTLRVLVVQDWFKISASNVQVLCKSCSEKIVGE